ncbi:MAG: ABC transporter permease subunit [Mesorhizobium sp.]|uniref:ABC transporter permease n=1 Tax=unclassified Mesorhizobium TaxID=325217 RepID=UPI000F756B92|nr:MULTISPECIES: ABC transporter permease [unclassified Mesorhizobium]RVC71054.1 ABC transporter permease subunit [Mesorhizobium sp. M00.F.Ca.ET.038.03.1.1]RVC80621.1 ABC transporter permease subunit [Mesorhizobium sp. M2A.F.Ca.ET.046.02.1.1]AZO34847.1 ABC transporter permease [Mesorhizobium sp. M2A.F.Ca.ET.046.03.2.1]RWE14863.1 MAG: ABC transporter permease subunit [Mesorhizobium sp.]RWE99583.1 MAG: ABC transporter permease subunit [Mesorhizobium sp.]
MRERISRGLAPLILWVAALILIVVAWQLVIVVSGLPPYVIPSPAQAFGTLAEKWPELKILTGQTLYETGIGYVVGALIGFVLALVMGQIGFVRRLIMPALIVSQAVPIVAVAAPLVIVFGFGLTPKLIIVAWIVFFPVVVNVLDGLASIDRDMINLARLMGGSPLRVFLIVKLPACVGPLFSGLKIGATYAVTGAVIGEWTASANQGLGTFLLSSNARMDTAGVYAAMLLLTAIGVGSFLIVLGMEIVATPWRTRSTAPKWLR